MLILANEKFQKTIVKICLFVLVLSIFLFETDIAITRASNFTFASINNRQVHVISGDTVWSIAAKFTSKDQDIRKLVVAIRQANQLSNDAAIFPGQILTIPVAQ